MEQRYFAFLDILGFSALVRKIGQDSNQYQWLLSILRDIHVRIPPGLVEGEAKFRAQQFSDTIIFSAATNVSGLWHLLLSVDALFFALLQQGVFIRGGVTKGLLHHDDRVVFGEALLDAYHLEAEVSNFPRVVLSKQVFADTNDYAANFDWAAVYRNSRLIRADDGPAFVHILSEIEIFNQQLRSESTPKADGYPLIVVGEKIAEMLSHRLDEAMDNPSHFLKVKWFVDYWNRTVCAGQNFQGRWLQPILIPGDLNNRAEVRLPFRHL